MDDKQQQISEEERSKLVEEFKKRLVDDKLPVIERKEDATR